MLHSTDENNHEIIDTVGMSDVTSSSDVYLLLSIYSSSSNEDALPHKTCNVSDGPLQLLINQIFIVG